MQQSSLPLYVKRKDETVKTGAISEYHFGRYFWGALLDATAECELQPEDGELVITAGCEPDPVHSTGSTHFDAKAIDVRIYNLVGLDGLSVYSPRWWQHMVVWATTAAVAMPEYVFVLERNHLHIQVGYDNMVSRPMVHIIPNLYIPHGL